MSMIPNQIPKTKLQTPKKSQVPSRIDCVALLAERAHRLVAEFTAVLRRADDGDGLHRGMFTVKRGRARLMARPNRRRGPFQLRRLLESDLVPRPQDCNTRLPPIPSPCASGEARERG